MQQSNCDQSSVRWYAIYTLSRNERRVNERLMEKGIHTFLPLRKTLRQWSDRKKWVEHPLLSSYIFVKITPKQYYSVLETQGVVHFITFEGKAVPIPQKQIDNLVLLINSDAEVETTTIEFEKGRKVEVNIGTLKGLTGELINRGRNKRFLIRIDHINQNLLVNIPASHLVYIN